MAAFAVLSPTIALTVWTISGRLVCDKARGMCRWIMVAALLGAGGCMRVAGVAAPPGLQPADDCQTVAHRYAQVVQDSRWHSRFGTTIPGRPWLRVMRGWDVWPMPHDPAARQAWVTAAATLSRQALAAELRNHPRIAPELVDAMHTCAAHDVATVAAWPDADWRALRASARVADDYSMSRRVLGAYPLARVGLQLGIADWRRQFAADYGRALTGNLVGWSPSPAGVAALANDLLETLPAMPGLSVPHSDVLARWLLQHAPDWRIQTRNAVDYPGWPAWRGDTLVLDIGQPEVAVLLMPAMVDGVARLQLIYTLWFAGRAATGWLDPYAGALDAVVWRVTLDEDGRVLMRDAMHACGCYHMVFPVDARQQANPELPEPVLVPEAVAGDGPQTVTLRAGDHQIMDVRGGRQNATADYRLRPYTDLLSLPLAGGDARRSLFDADGLVGVSRRAERRFLWPSGVISPGAMRIWGHHPIAFVGRRHADTPNLFQHVLIDSRAETKSKPPATGITRGPNFAADPGG